MTCSTSTIAATGVTWFDRCNWWSMLTCRAIRRARAASVPPRRLHSSAGCTESRATTRCTRTFWTSWVGRGGWQQNETDSRGQRGAIHGLKEREGRHVALACGSGGAHPVSLAHFTCTLFPIYNYLQHPRLRRWSHAIFCLYGQRALGRSSRRRL